MPEEHHPVAGRLRFGVFEMDLPAGELRKHGLKIRIQEQPFQVLAMLVQNAGKVVTREDLQKKLWPADTFVEFDHGLNKAINTIRKAHLWTQSYEGELRDTLTLQNKVASAIADQIRINL